MRYVWEKVGDQERLTRKVCYLGPYLLEHVEEYWKPTDNIDRFGERERIMMMASRVWLWDDKNKIPELLLELPEIEYNSEESHKILEDWYGANVLFEKLFTGDSDVLQKEKP